MRKIILTALVLLAGQISFGQLVTHRGVIPEGYDFWVNIPEGCAPADSVKVPTIIFLHGKSLSGNNLNTVLRYGCLDALKYNLDIPALIVAPQSPGGSWVPGKVMDVLEWVEGHYPVDTNRVYVFGMSMGGSGTINFTGTYPDKVAAAIAMCGGGHLKDYSGLKNVPLWVIHGYNDEAVSWKNSQKVVDGLKAAGDTTRLHYDFIKGVNHSILARVFYMQDAYDWLFRHSLRDSTRAASRDCSMSLSKLENAYRPFYGQKKKVLTVLDYDKETGELKKSDRPSSAGGEPSGTGGTAGTAAGSPKYITIKEGDCLSKIAQREHTTVDKLCSLNGISRNSVIRAGKKLRVR